MIEKVKIIDRDQLKYIAAVFMFVGHFLTYTVKELHFLGLPSVAAKTLMYSVYIAPPIFMFFISEGFYYTKSKAQYAVRLLITGIITQFAFVLANTGRMDWNMFLCSGNIILTLLISLCVLMIYKSKWNVFSRVFLMLVLIGVTYLWNMEWAVLAPLMVFAFYGLRNRPVWRFVVYEIFMLGYVAVTMGGLTALTQNLCFLLAVQIPIIVLSFFYSGKRGKYPSFSKYFFYIFYPAHMLLIFVVKLLVI